MDSGFTPQIWQEDELPKEAEEYRQCEICTAKSRPIWGEGNPHAPVMVILDNPGAREDRDGNEYVCGTRQTLQQALHRCKLSAGEVYVTYLLKCRPLRSYDKKAVRAFSKPFLLRQIEQLRPEWIVCLGDVVVRAMFEEDACVKSLRGKPLVLLGRPCMVSYHPLAIRRRPNLMPLFLEDWEMLTQALKQRGAPQA